MSKPIRHYDGWRIRWTDEHGRRRSKTLQSKTDAELELRHRQLAAEERKLGLRPPERKAKFFHHAADWRRSRRTAAFRPRFSRSCFKATSQFQ